MRAGGFIRWRERAAHGRGDPLAVGVVGVALCHAAIRHASQQVVERRYIKSKQLDIIGKFSTEHHTSIAFSN